MLGYGDISAEGWQDSNIWTTFGNLKVQASKTTQLTAAFMHTNTGNTSTSETMTVDGTSVNIPVLAWNARRFAAEPR